jgi:hypothetical protein
VVSNVTVAAYEDERSAAAEAKVEVFMLQCVKVDEIWLNSGWKRGVSEIVNERR